jgi:protocatechuate 3,4-dioxygenase beta subunit
MRESWKQIANGLTRRQALSGAAATLGLGLAAGKSAGANAQQRIAAALPGAKVCVLTPQATEGPFYFDPKLVRADITEGKQGAPLTLTLQVVNAKDCARLEQTRVDVWHSDGLGLYSGYAGQETGSARGETFLRGTQFANDDGEVRFETIYPGWYPGRTPHIHYKVFTDPASVATGQLYFPDALSTRIYATIPPYDARKAERDTDNGNDFIFQRQGGAETLLKIDENDGRYLASLVIGVDRTG